MTEQNTVNSVHAKGVIQQKATFKMMSNSIHKKQKCLWATF